MTGSAARSTSTRLEDPNANELNTWTAKLMDEIATVPSCAT